MTKFEGRIVTYVFPFILSQKWNYSSQGDPFSIYKIDGECELFVVFDTFTKIELPDDIIKKCHY